MKIKMLICSALAAGLLTGCVNINVGSHSGSCKKSESGEKREKAEKGEKGEAKAKKENQAELMAQAKISKDTAQQTALTKAPGGTVKDYELEMENGKLIWSFVFATPDTKDYFTEVNVDALTGDIVNVEKESAKSEAKEAAGEKDGDNDKDKN